MVEYRVYEIGDDGHIVGSTPLVSSDDGEAIKQAKRAAEDRSVEIWSGERFVIRLGNPSDDQSD